MADRTANTPAYAPGAPDFKTPETEHFRHALRAGWRDFRAAPAFGLITAALSVLAGWGIVWLSWWSGHTFWLILAVMGFPLVAPFAALGTYEVSRRLDQGAPVGMGDILRVLWAERARQVPWLCAIMVVVLLFWFFIGHMIFALFLGLAPMTNISSSFEVFLSGSGLAMLGLGTVVGGAFALLLFAICVLGLPLLLDREVDYVTAMIRSIGMVLAHPVPMLSWAFFVAVVCLLALVPGFLGVLVVLPWLGHASWHLYAALKEG